MAQTARQISGLWSHSPEIKSELIADKEGTEKRMTRAARALIETWYEGKGEVVFDKGRFWNLNAPILHQLFPDAKLLVCVRDLRAIFASVEKQHAKNPLLDDAGNPMEVTAYNRADRMFSPQGLIGQQIMGIEDLLRRRLPFVHTVQYETFVANPQLVLDRIYTAIGEEPFNHNFDNVENTATDVDGIYNCKFPHEGQGKIEDRQEDWQEHVPSDIAQLIMGKFVGYNRAFGYQ
jgi:sulfotransferase